jgi:hypothetical protein
MTIHAPAMSECDRTTRLSADVTFPDGTRTLWFACDKAHANGFTPEASDAFVVAALIVAMRRGLDIAVEGSMSSRLHYHLTTSYMELLSSLLPDIRVVDIEAKRLHRTIWRGSGAITGFSGGIDSFCTVLEHRAGRVQQEYAITHLLFNNVGSHGQSERDDQVFANRFVRLENVARDCFASPLIAVDSNLDDFIGMDFQLTHTLRNVAVALLFQNLAAKFLYSSTVHFRDCRVRPTYDIGYADAIGVPLLSTESMECISSGSRHTRFGKTELVAADPATFAALDVCVMPQVGGRTNCSTCWKCLRTELALEVIGALPNYATAFDLDAYRRLRWIYLCEVLRSEQPLLKEIRAGMGSHGYKVPASARVAATILPGIVFDVLRRAGARRSR